jgi:hypothetical protein
MPDSTTTPNAWPISVQANFESKRKKESQLLSQKFVAGICKITTDCAGLILNRA